MSQNCVQHPTNMCIKSAPYLHQKNANKLLSVVFFYALVLMLLNKLFQNSTFRKWSSGIHLFNYDAKFLHQIYCKFVPIKKDALHRHMNPIIR